MKSRPCAILRPSSADNRAGNDARVVGGSRFSAISGRGAGPASLCRDRREDRLKVPVLGRAERDSLPLSGHHEPGRDRLHPPRRQPWHDLLPQHRRDLVPVQAVEHPPGLVGVHQPAVQLARVRHRLRDRLRRDLVEDHAAGGHPGLELLQQVPGDRLALAVLVRGEQEFVGAGEQLLELGDLGLLVRVHHVQSLEVVVHVDAEPRPRLLAVLDRDLGGLVGHVPDVADARLHHVVPAQVPGDRARLGGGLDDDQAMAAAPPGSICRARLVGYSAVPPRPWRRLESLLARLSPSSPVPLSSVCHAGPTSGPCIRVSNSPAPTGVPGGV